MQAKAMVWLLSFKSASQNLGWVLTGHTATYRVNIQSKLSVCNPTLHCQMLCCPPCHHFPAVGPQCAGHAVPAGGSKEQLPAPAACARVGQQCRCV